MSTVVSSWRHVSTRLLGIIGAISTIVSIVALVVAMMALNSAVHQQAQQARRDAQQAATAAALQTAQMAALDAACQIYAFNIGEPSDPAPSTARGQTLAQRARAQYRELGCKPPLAPFSSSKETP